MGLIHTIRSLFGSVGASSEAVVMTTTPFLNEDRTHVNATCETMEDAIAVSEHWRSHPQCVTSFVRGLRVEATFNGTPMLTLPGLGRKLASATVDEPFKR